MQRHCTKVATSHNKRSPAKHIPTIATILHVLLSMHVSQLLNDSAVDLMSRRKREAAYAFGQRSSCIFQFVRFNFFDGLSSVFVKEIVVNKKEGDAIEFDSKTVVIPRRHEKNWVRSARVLFMTKLRRGVLNENGCCARPWLRGCVCMTSQPICPFGG